MISVSDPTHFNSDSGPGTTMAGVKSTNIDCCALIECVDCDVKRNGEWLII